MSPKKDRPSPRQRPPRKRPRPLRAPQKRATYPSFVRRFSLRFLAPLPLQWGPAGTPPRFSPGHYRSFYRPCGQARRRRFWAHVLADPRRHPSWFELALTLIDGSPLRALLEAPFSSCGEKPFDPLSLLLVCLWKIASAQPWDTVAAVLADTEKGAAWRTLFGFSLHDTPAESTLRAFRDRLPEGFLNTLLQLFLQTLDRSGLLPAVDPYGYLLSGDGQLHDARSAHRCHHARSTCYQAIGPGQTRPCPAHEATQGHYGCACDTEACQPRCALAPRLDPEAGFVIYSETKRTEQGEKVEQIKRAVFGYRSLATRLLDEQLHLAWTARTDLYAAPTDEGSTFPTAFRAAVANLPQPRVAYAFYDSACGEKQCLDVVYDLGGIPLFDLRSEAGDRDPALCRARGYDEHGHVRHEVA